MSVGPEKLNRKRAESVYNRGLEATVAKLLALSVALQMAFAENEKLNSEKAEADKEIKRLRAALAGAKMVSPATPSGAIPAFKKPDSTKKPRCRRRPGRRKGHPGTTRKIPEHTDREQVHAPLEQCPKCKETLDAASTVEADRIIEGIIAGASEAVRHVRCGRFCQTCDEYVFAPVLDAMPNDRISLYSYVLTAWLHYSSGLSMSNCAKLLGHCGLSLTKGALAQGWQRLAGHLLPAYQQILERATGSLVLMADETSWRIWGIRHWLWYFGSRYWSYYVIDRHRSKAVVMEVLGELFEGVLITDFYAAYDAIGTWAKQRCIFHLFTELRKVDLRNDDLTWRWFRQKLVRILRDAISLAANDKINHATFERRKQRLHHRLDRLLELPTDDKDTLRLIKRLHRYRDEVLTFLDYAPIVSAYNNHSEQQMRVPVQSRRISQGNRSSAGAEAQVVLMSLFRSAELQGRDPVQYVLQLMHDAIAGRPLVLPLAPDMADQFAAAA